MATKKSKGNIATVILLLVMALGTVIYKTCQRNQQTYPTRTINTTPGDWRSHKLIYTKHARCRMECREITEAEVEYIVANGTVNEAKSKEADAEATGQCPTYAVEGKSKDGQQLRVIFGACEKITKVITAIDLGEEHACNCR